MSTNEYEEDILVTIEEDNINEFIRLTNKFKNWNTYLIKDENEYFIHYSLKHKAVNIIKYMLKYGIDLNLKDNELQSSLHISMSNDLCNINTAIINNQEYEYCRDIEGNNEYHKWVNNGCLICLYALMKKNLDYNVKNSKGNNPLHQAVIRNNQESLRLLLENCQFDLEEKGEFDYNLIQLACVYSDLKIFQYLLQLNTFKLDILTSSKESLLTLSVNNQKYSISEELINLNIKISSKDIRRALEDSQIKLYRKLKEIYDEKYKGQKDRSSSRNSRKNEYSSSESYDNIMNQYRKSSDIYSVSAKQSYKKFGNNEQNICNIKIDEVSFSHKKPNLQNKLYMKYNESSGGLSGTSCPIDTSIKSNDRKMNNSNSDSSGNFSNFNNTNKNSNPNLTNNLRNIDINKSTPLDHNHTQTRHIRKFSDSNMIRRSVEKRSESINRLKQNEKKKESEKEKKLDIDSLIKIEFVKSFSELNFSDIKHEKEIYQNDICIIYKGKYQYLPVAIKCYNLSKLSQQNIQSINYEINLLMSLRHPNIVTFIGHCHNKNNFYLITEFLEKKSLKLVLDNKKLELTLLQKLQICLDISLGINYLHTRNPLVLHRDLKSSNCLVDRNNRVKLCDFGLSKFYENSNRQTNSSSTCFWMAPEFIVNKTFNEKSDIYSLGILFWEIFMRDTIPYKDMNELTFLLGDFEVLKKRPIIPNEFDPEIRKLIENCWEMDYNKRPVISDIIKIIENFIEKFS